MKIIIQLQVIALFVFNSTIAKANSNDLQIAEVVKIRGDVTMLAPRARLAHKVEIGDKFLEDTSILTGSKSFIKIKFIDNTEINLGPDSKIVIAEMKKDSVGIISLLKGRLRTEVQKDTNKPEVNKFFIRTRTAALGVRGTDFQTIYNPDIKMTSLLTYRGEVAMAKVDEKTNDRLEENSERVVERDDVTKAPSIKDAPAKTIDEAEELNKVLKGKGVVLVPPGQNSFSSEALKKITLPVKISPVQLEVLYKNQEFQEKSKENFNAKSDENFKPTLKVAAQSSPAEGLYNAKTGDFAPKSGGFIDLASGLYVAPDSDAKLDAKTGVYQASKVGNVDSDTGQYIAPKGLILDAKKGFVLDGETDKPELLALRQDLNKTIARDIVVGIDHAKIEEKFIRDRISFTLASLDQQLKLNQGSTTSPYLGVGSNSSIRMAFDWQMATNNRFSPILGIDFSNVSFRDQLNSNLTEGSHKLMGLSFGSQYALLKNVNLFGKLGLHQEHFLDQTASGSPNTFNLKKIVLTRLTFGADAEFWRHEAWSLNASLSGLFTFRKRINNVVVNEGLGSQFEILPKYRLSERKWIGLGIKIENEYQRVAGSTGVNQEKRNTSGVEFKYINDF